MDDNSELTPMDSDPEEEMRLENDIMKLKLQAEFGARFGETTEDMPPELEQQFLQHVYDFEKAWQNQQPTTVAHILGDPVFRPVDDMGAEELEEEWAKVLEIYNAKGISVDFSYEYPLVVKYRFATEELPLHETMFVNMPGMMLGFIYEEFHPNHGADMEQKARRFLQAWLAQDAVLVLETLANQYIGENGELAEKEDTEKRLALIFDAFESFDEGVFEIKNISYELNDSDEENALSLGFVEGFIHWKALLDNGEAVPMGGAFKLFFEYRFDWWAIIHFKMPGWKW